MCAMIFIAHRIPNLFPSIKYTHTHTHTHTQELCPQDIQPTSVAASVRPPLLPPAENPLRQGQSLQHQDLVEIPVQLSPTHSTIGDFS